MRISGQGHFRLRLVNRERSCFDFERVLFFCLHLHGTEGAVLLFPCIISYLVNWLSGLLAVVVSGRSVLRLTAFISNRKRVCRWLMAIEFKMLQVGKIP